MSSAPPPRTPRLSPETWFTLVLLLLFVALSVQYTVKALQGRGAFTRWSPQVEALDRDENIYQRYNYPNPPIMALILRPLTKLPPLAGALAWFYLKVGMTLLALRWAFRLVEDPGRPFPLWAKVLAAVLALRPVLGDLSHGNINLFILFLVVGSLYAFRRGRDLTAGVVLALAVACKVTPALFLPYFLWKRAYRTLAGCAVGLVLFFVLVPSLFLGWQENANLLASWTDQMVRPFVVEGVVTSEHNNQSLPGLLYRLGTHSPSFSDYVNHVYTPTAYHNVLDLSPGLVRWLLKGCMGLFALLVVWTCRTPASVRGGWRPAAEFGVVLLGMLLFSERTWKHHCVTLLVPFAVVAYYLAVCRPAWPLRGYLAGTLTAVAILMALTSTSLPGWDRGAKLAQTYGAYVWGYLLLLGALAVLLRQPAAAAAASRRPVDGRPWARIAEPGRKAG